MDSPRLKWLRLVAAVCLLLIASAVAVLAFRRPILQAAGWALVVDDAIVPSDAIVVTVDSGDGGVLEAADLVRSGIATRVGIFVEPAKPAAREFVRRGIPYEDTAARSARHLRSLGVTRIEQVPGTVVGSEAESQALLEWCAQQQLRSVVVVSNPDHSRRLRRVFHRSVRDSRLRVLVRSARYSSFDPDRWWETRDGIRTEIVEVQKLLFDVARHPIS